MLYPAVLALAICLTVNTLTATAAEHGVILQYHHIANDTPPSTSTKPMDFRRHLEYLRDNDFNVIALDELVESLRAGREVPDKSIAITFDDGYISIYNEAFPLLQSFGFPFTLFVSTQPIDDNQAGYMNWSQITEMANAGTLIANHMVNHPYMLERLGSESDQEWIGRLRAEMLEAEERIRVNTGQSLRYLAYPYGEFDPSIQKMLSDEGFVGLAQNSGAVGFESDFLALPRYPLGGSFGDLESAVQKFESLAFNVKLLSPLSPVTTSNNPAVRLQFLPGPYTTTQIGCFANSEPLPMTWTDRDAGIVELTPEASFSGRRWRYICTAPMAGTKRYFWFSVQWINPEIEE